MSLAAPLGSRGIPCLGLLPSPRHVPARHLSKLQTAAAASGVLVGACLPSAGAAACRGRCHHRAECLLSDSSCLPWAGRPTRCFFPELPTGDSTYWPKESSSCPSASPLTSNLSVHTYNFSFAKTKCPGEVLPLGGGFERAVLRLLCACLQDLPPFFIQVRQKQTHIQVWFCWD